MSAATRVPVVVDGIRYLAALDDASPGGMLTRAIVRGRLVDELTGQPVSGPITVQPAGGAFTTPRARAAVNPRSADGGLVGLVGVPVQALPLLGSTSYDVGVTARAPGYMTSTATRLVGPIALYPSVFHAADVGDIMMHRTPVILQGRANARTATTFNPLANALVTLTGLWRTPPTLIASPPASSPDLVAIDPPLYAARQSGGTANAVALTPDLLHEKRVMQDVPAGSTTVVLSDRVALVGTNLLGIDETDPSLAEWVVVQSVAGATSPTLPAVATLAYPLARTHRAGARAHPTTIGAPTGSQTLSLSAQGGDVTLLLAGMAGMVPAAVEIDDGVGANEYHRLSRYEATTDADGQWRLPPLSRVAQITLDGTDTMTSFTVPQRTVTLEYPRNEQRLDLVFT